MWLCQIFLLIVINVFNIDATNDTHKDEWWRNSYIYQVYIRSFKDSNGDGVGDLKGITSKLDYIKDLGISIIYIQPFYSSPMTDSGYDIIDFKAIDPLFGNFNDFGELIEKAKTLDMKVIIDFVPNHTSVKHPWFIKSILREKPYDDYYVWFDGKEVNGTRQPPTNWLSIFHGSAWTWNEHRQQYYYRTFAKTQPDLNYRNPKVNEEMKNIIRFWLEKGIDGIRVDSIPSLVEGNPDEAFPLKDQPKKLNTTYDDDFFYSQEPIFVYNPSGSYPIVQSWRNVLNEYSSSKKIILLEAVFLTVEIEKSIKYYNYGAIPMNYIFTDEIHTDTTMSELIDLIKIYLKAIPNGKSPNWSYNNHDRSRIATKLGRNRADQMIMLTTVLPGIVIIYQGEELGMEDRQMTWDETVDPAGCNLGPDRYNMSSRDPSRSPFQWDNTTSAGFSTNNKTWLPVHNNYKQFNLEAQKIANNSHYQIYKKVIALKQECVVREGGIKLINMDEKVLIVIRHPGEGLENFKCLDQEDLVVLLINFTNDKVRVNLADYLNVKNWTVYVASLASHIKVGSTIEADHIDLPHSASVILVKN